MSLLSFSTARLITWKKVLTGRTVSTSSIQREASQAQGHRGSNQRSTVLDSCTSGAGSAAGTTSARIVSTLIDFALIDFALIALAGDFLLALADFLAFLPMAQDYEESRGRIDPMFPDNLMRAEAQQRARLIETEAYAVEVDLSGRDVADPDGQFLSTSSLTFRARADGATHLDLIADEVRSARLDGVDLDPAGFQDSRLPLTLTAGPHTLTVQAVCRYSRSGQGLHRFVDPVDGRRYLYTQFEVADARRMYALLRAARPEGPIHRLGGGSGGLDGGVQRAWWPRSGTAATTSRSPGSPKRCPSRPT